MRKNVDFTVLNESLKPYLHLKHTIWLFQSNKVSLAMVDIVKKRKIKQVF